MASGLEDGLGSLLPRDSQNRDVVIKVIERNSMEYQIYQYLYQHKDVFRPETFPCVLPPVAIMDSPYNFSFVATPQWIAYVRQDSLECVRDMLVYIRSLLTGLEFLHRHRIVHRDISESNIAMNFYSHYGRLISEFNSSLREQRRASKIVYALFDYNISIKFPEETPLGDCWLDATLAYDGFPPYHPSDIFRGQYRYNPFAFDVGCLGNLFMVNFLEAIPLVPLLAPLFSKMTTHVIEDRFTASEALSFFTEIWDQLSDDVLDTSIKLEEFPDARLNPSMCWSKLGPEFCSRWKSHRTPPIPWYYHVIDLIASFSLGWRFVCFVRRTLRV
ncbi:hypothetical protein K474DRAFT_1683352 [Panus rudis PR-1116 ss-1]|nr:hypothetical protein K474DRAFT_1683352 [Panus rudis PR-1116 ss-1]